MRSNPGVQGHSEQSALKASQLLERSFADLYTRIQDFPGKDNSWKTELIDRLETVSFYR